MASLADIRKRPEHAKPLNHQWVESRAQNERGFGAAAFDRASQQETS